MTVESLTIGKTMMLHTIVPTIENRSCLFREIYCLLYNTQVMVIEVHEQIVSLAVANWEELAFCLTAVTGIITSVSVNTLLTCHTLSRMVVYVS